MPRLPSACCSWRTISQRSPSLCSDADGALARTESGISASSSACGASRPGVRKSPAAGAQPGPAPGSLLTFDRHPRLAVQVMLQKSPRMRAGAWVRTISSRSPARHWMALSVGARRSSSRSTRPAARIQALPPRQRPDLEGRRLRPPGRYRRSPRPGFLPLAQGRGVAIIDLHRGEQAPRPALQPALHALGEAAELLVLAISHTAGRSSGHRGWRPGQAPCVRKPRRRPAPHRRRRCWTTNSALRASASCPADPARHSDLTPHRQPGPPATAGVYASCLAKLPGWRS